MILCGMCINAQAGIAKGVRRIVAVTRGLALAAVERAKTFEQQLDVADGIEDISLDTTVSTSILQILGLCLSSRPWGHETCYPFVFSQGRG